MPMAGANFLELRACEVRRIPLPRTPVNTASSSGIIVAIRERNSAEMAEQQRLPNLQELDEQQAYRFLTELLSTKSRDEVYEANHPEDYIMEMPQSGEAIRGRENMRRFQEAYPGDAPSLRLRRVLVREGLWVVSLYLQVKRSSSKRLDTGIEGQ